MKYSIYWTKQSGVITDRPQEDGGSRGLEINKAYGQLERCKNEYPSWDGFIGESTKDFLHYF